MESKEKSRAFISTLNLNGQLFRHPGRALLFFFPLYYPPFVLSRPLSFLLNPLSFLLVFIISNKGTILIESFGLYLLL